MTINNYKKLYLTGKKDSYIAYEQLIGSGPGIIFLPGYYTDMHGKKASYLYNFCYKNNISFIRFDYQGHGNSSGEFTDGTIGKWLANTLQIIDKLTDSPQILIGSSMGGWLMFLAALARPERIAGLIGIAAAPDFTHKLLWKKLPEHAKQAIENNNIWYTPPENGNMPLTKRLFTESTEHLIMDSKISIKCPVHLLQGMQDQQVPWQHSYKIQELLDCADVIVTLIKNGDHSLSSPLECLRIALAMQQMQNIINSNV